ncbi:MAG: hypothetical protein Q8J74_12135, partial [Candidatus Didemnitutus sp.]|nr:hypothetical protein [Candidatus Didemnitutus sp.]
MTISSGTLITACARLYYNSRPAKSRLLALGLALLAAGSGAAAAMGNPIPPGTAAVVKPAADLIALGDDELILEEVFTSHLPTTLKKFSFRLSMHPHLGDWQKKDHLRLSTSLRYGLTENCEISASSKLYFSHGHGDIHAFDNYGAANLRLGVKLNLERLLFSNWETGVGISYEFPTDRPPAELTDGLRHLRPYVTFSRRLESRPAMRIFVGFRLDAVTKTSLPGEFGKNAFRESSTGITGGWVIDHGNLHYTFEASFDTTRLISRTGKDVYTIRPGVLWEIPTRRDPQIRSNWMIGFALTDTFGPGGNSVGAS